MEMTNPSIVADLRNQFATVSKWIHGSVPIITTRRGKPLANLSPVRRRRKAGPVDRLARLRKLFPDGPVEGDSRTVVDYDRGDR